MNFKNYEEYGNAFDLDLLTILDRLHVSYSRRSGVVGRRNHLRLVYLNSLTSQETCFGLITRFLRGKSSKGRCYEGHDGYHCVCCEIFLSMAMILFQCENGCSQEMLKNELTFSFVRYYITICSSFKLLFFIVNCQNFNVFFFLPQSVH